MNEALKRELNKTYLVLNSEDIDYEETYELQMILRNSLETLLPLHVLRLNQALQLYYDVSAKQTLLEWAERQKISKETVCNLFKTIDRLYKELKEYLLDADHIVLDLKHIYIQEERFYFCYCPWESKDTLNAVRDLLEELLGHLDYHDTKGVELAYHFYQSACRGTIQIEDILKEHSEEPQILENNDFINEVDLFEEEEKNQETLEREASNLEEKKQKRKMPKFLRKVLRFFLKKQETESGVQEMQENPSETWGNMFYELGEPEKNSEMVNHGNTMLLDKMIARSWHLHPLQMEYPAFEIQGESFVIGKKKDVVDGCIQRNTVSRIHSRLSVRDGRLFVADVNSTNGTFVNGVVIEPGREVEIFTGDRILFADVGYECYNSL